MQRLKTKAKPLWLKANATMTDRREDAPVGYKRPPNHSRVKADSWMAGERAKPQGGLLGELAGLTSIRETVTTTYAAE